MLFKSFFGVTTLQVGVSLLSIVFLLIAWTVLTVNVFNYYDEPTVSWPAPLFIIIVFVVFTLLTGLVMFLAAYDENRKNTLSALVLVAIITVSWIILSIVSFENRPENLKLICNHLKCPESLWLAELSYRNWRTDIVGCKKPYINTVQIPTQVKDSSSTSVTKSIISTKASTISLVSPGTTLSTTLDQNEETIQPATITSTMNTSSEVPAVTSTSVYPSIGFRTIPSSNQTTNVSEDVKTTEVDTNAGGATGIRRKRWDSKYKLTKNLITTPISLVLSTNLIQSSTPIKNTDKMNNFLCRNSNTSQEESTSYVYEEQFAGAVVLFIINFMFFLISALTLWSYSQELLWLYS